MSLSEVKNRGEEVIFKMVKHEVDKYQMLNTDDVDEILLYSYIVLVNVNKKQIKLYLDKHMSFPFKALLLILL